MESPNILMVGFKTSSFFCCCPSYFLIFAAHCPTLILCPSYFRCPPKQFQLYTLGTNVFSLGGQKTLPKLLVWAAASLPKLCWAESLCPTAWAACPRGWACFLNHRVKHGRAYYVESSGVDHVLISRCVTTHFHISKAS